MIERIARALNNSGHSFENLPSHFRDLFYWQALTAIRAIRDPTKAMCEAVENDTPLYMTYSLKAEDAAEIYTRMIDTILTEDEK